MNTFQRITDARGNANNLIEIRRFKPYYDGYMIENLQPVEKSKNLYHIISNNKVLGTIGLNEEDFNFINPLTGANQIDFTRVAHDTSGNSRFVCHFLAFTDYELDKDVELSAKYDLALRRARQLGGRKFHNKQYGGGIVFQMYDGEQAEMSVKIKNIMKELKQQEATA